MKWSIQRDGFSKEDHDGEKETYSGRAWPRLRRARDQVKLEQCKRDPVSFPLSSRNGADVTLGHDAQRREVRTDRLGNVGRGQVRVVPFRHARVRMA